MSYAGRKPPSCELTNEAMIAQMIVAIPDSDVENDPPEQLLEVRGRHASSRHDRK
jgi:hypothetical protein